MKIPVYSYIKKEEYGPRNVAVYANVDLESQLVEFSLSIGREWFKGGHFPIWELRKLVNRLYVELDKQNQEMRLDYNYIYYSSTERKNKLIQQAYQSEKTLPKYSCGYDIRDQLIRFDQFPAHKKPVSIAFLVDLLERLESYHRKSIA